MVWNFGPLFVLWHSAFRLATRFCSRGLSRRSAAARLLGLWVRIPPGAWTSVCCECCVLSDRGLCDELITRPEESYRLWWVVCDLATSLMRRSWPALGRSANRKKNSFPLKPEWTPGILNAYRKNRLLGNSPRTLPGVETRTSRLVV